MYRKKHEKDPDYEVRTYEIKTSTSIKCNHHMEKHPDLWLISCDDKNIAIRGRSVIGAVHVYCVAHNQPVDPSMSQESISEFSKDAFVDAVVTWIIEVNQSLCVIENPKL
ncbi:hypothetical protein Moror_3733 [Moniliophthora roreri MCA 2997]|uniref:Uncharacterized protein n=2 Tax=Moniliophthora roreri TaxID=221103 RepID=V2WLD7_MONRO|nr:hypothetical protein Moror_3733 [Moniliophthora roreri MCA 2997]